MKKSASPADGEGPIGDGRAFFRASPQRKKGRRKDAKKPGERPTKSPARGRKKAATLPPLL